MVNYISQLSAVMSKFSEDDRLNTAHVSLYIALFQFWNLNRFENPISINRSEVMRVSKIGSKTTYHRCINDLNDWGYLEYIPSKNPMKGSTINMFNFGTSTGLALDKYSPKFGQVVGQVVVSSINNKNSSNNSNINKGDHQPPVKTQKRFEPPTMEEVKIFFSQNNSSALEGEKFFNHFQSNGWLVGGRTKMKDWRAAARGWILRSGKFTENTNATLNRLNAIQNTKYDEPL
jgi:hypothetical protein